MSSTQHTGHYNLPTFGDNPNDRPSWRGDFPGRSQFPYGKSMPENPPADMAFITQSEADARYVERNPTADNFDSKE